MEVGEARSVGWTRRAGGRDEGLGGGVRGTEMLLPVWLRLMGSLNTPRFPFKIVR
ncbi:MULTISPECIES: hypothetical protein [unclassified Micromonospora]|uniref:hypothetical protein n=1 Tax=unclassified Micromonospora TaxID=2617518 RepID=UPI002FF3D1D7